MYTNSSKVLSAMLKAMLDEVPSVDVTWAPAVSGYPMDDADQPARLALTPSGGGPVVCMWYDGPTKLAEVLGIELPPRLRSLTVYLKGGQLTAHNVLP